MNEPLLNLSETAMLLGCSVPTLRHLVADGKLPAYKLRDHTSPLKFRRQDIDDFLARRRIEPKVVA
jgi:excisionase family DNA binding protein